jgi:hypothetical protein
VQVPEAIWQVQRSVSLQINLLTWHPCSEDDLALLELLQYGTVSMHVLLSVQRQVLAAAPLYHSIPYGFNHA